MKKLRGFTLVELLITVAIVAILATIAYPSYLEFMQKARRADAHSAITALQLAQERLRGSCKFYAENIADADACGANAGATNVHSTGIIKDGTVYKSKDGHYQLSILDGFSSGNRYEIQAAPIGDQAGDTDCDPIKLTVNPLNPSGSKTPAECWE